MWKMWTLYTVDGNVDGVAAMENSTAVPSKN